MNSDVLNAGMLKEFFKFLKMKNISLKSTAYQAAILLFSKVTTVKLGYNELGYNELGYNEHGYIELGYNENIIWLVKAIFSVITKKNRF
jgi:hypothetical protein